MNKVFLIIYVLLIGSCANLNRKRQLTKQEMLKYNLKGNLSEAKICPTQMNNNNTGLVVSGACEVVSCRWADNKTDNTTDGTTDGTTECWAVPEKK